MIPTYNRGEVLRRTLDDFTRVNHSGVNWHLVVIDNNCTDNTAAVVAEYLKRLPLSLLKEPRPGKNCALNKALRECSLKDIVVFTDDDVTPASDWLTEIVVSTNKWPEVPVFGGRIELLWPEGQPPAWAAADWIEGFAFCSHRYAKTQTFYRPPACPFGGNYWVRTSVFQKTQFFDETIGPRPTNRIMGSETSFLRSLQLQGFEMLYYPGAVVQHRILAKECQIPALRRRAYTFGRGQIRLHGLHRQNILLKSKVLWAATLGADWCYTALRFLVGSMLWNPKHNCEITVNAMMRFGQLRETISQVLRRAESPPKLSVPSPDRLEAGSLLAVKNDESTPMNSNSSRKAPQGLDSKVALPAEVQRESPIQSPIH